MFYNSRSDNSMDCKVCIHALILICCSFYSRNLHRDIQMLTSAVFGGFFYRKVYLVFTGVASFKFSTKGSGTMRLKESLGREFLAVIMLVITGTDLFWRCFTTENVAIYVAKKFSLVTVLCVKQNRTTNIDCLITAHPQELYHLLLTV